jgi:hypothetical protein
MSELENPTETDDTALASGWDEARTEPRPPENGSSPPVRRITAAIIDGDDSDFHDDFDRSCSPPMRAIEPHAVFPRRSAATYVMGG